MTDQEAVKKGLKRFQQMIESMGQPPKEVVFTESTQSGFLIKCEKCKGTIVSITPILYKGEPACGFWCMGCTNTLMLGGPQ